MTATAIIEQLDKLIRLHENLLRLAGDKTEAIKKNDMEKVEKLMLDEQKYIQAINQIETKRQQDVALFLGNPDGSFTLQDVIGLAEEQDKIRLTEQREQLLALIDDLKQLNSLNQQLIYQSLQYVNLSLDLLRPQSVHYNYDKPANAGVGKKAFSRGMFDSKA